MRKVLFWAKPERLRPFKEHAEKYQSDTNIAGTYIQNMSEEDKLRWKAKYIGGKEERVEIRKTFREPMGAQCLIIVKEDGIMLSLNGKAFLNWDDFEDFGQALTEAVDHMAAQK